MRYVYFYQWIFIFAVLLSGCESQPSKKEGSAAGVASLTQAQQQRFQQAIADLEQQQPQKSEPVLTALLRERANVAELWLNLALSQYQQGNLANAHKSVQRLLMLDANVAQGHNLAGLIAVEQGEFAKAQEHYQQAVKIDSNYANALYNMALLQDVYLQDVESAVAYYQRYLQLVKDDETTQAWAEHLSQTLNP